MQDFELNEIISILAGLSGFLGAVWINRIRLKDKAKYDLELESVKSKLAHQSAEQSSLLGRISIVHKSQFEKEFTSIQEIWELFDLAYIATRSVLIYEVDETVENPHQSEELDKNIINSVAAINAFSEKFRHSAPFIDESLDSLFKKVIPMLAGITNLALEAMHKSTKNEYDEVVKEIEPIFDEIHNERTILVNGVRKRISTMYVI